MNTQEFFEIPMDVLRSRYVNRRIWETFGLKDEQRMREWIDRQNRSPKPEITSRVWDWLNDEIRQPYATILQKHADPMLPNARFWKGFTHTPQVRAVIETLMQSPLAALYPCARFNRKQESSVNPSHIIACKDKIVSFITRRDNGRVETRLIEQIHPWTIVDALLSTWQRGGPRAHKVRAYLCACASRALKKTIARRRNKFDLIVAMTPDADRAFQAQTVVAWQIKDGVIEYVLYPQGLFRERKILHADVPYHQLSEKIDGLWRKKVELVHVLNNLQWRILDNPDYQFCFVLDYASDEGRLTDVGLLIVPMECMPPDIGKGTIVLRNHLHETTQAS